MSAEQWFDVPGFESVLRVNRDGRIKRLSYQRKNGRYIQPDFIIKQYYRGKYLAVAFFYGGRHHILSVHRVIALTFIPNPDNKPTVNHINGLKVDNRIENLEWATFSEQRLHAYKTGLQKSARNRLGIINELHPQSKPILQLDLATGKPVKEWPSLAEAGRNGFQTSAICRVIYGKSKQHLNYGWKHK